MVKNLIFLIMLISLVITISETQHTVYTEKDDDNDDELSEKDVAILCGASEDYEKNKEQCDKLYDMLEEGEIEDDHDFEYN